MSDSNLAAVAESGAAESEVRAHAVYADVTAPDWRVCAGGVSVAEPQRLGRPLRQDRRLGQHPAQRSTGRRGHQSLSGAGSRCM